MSQNALTVQNVVSRGLRYFGVVSLNPASPANQALPIEPTDIDDVLGCLNAAVQQCVKGSPSEVRESNVGANLNAPATVYFDCVNGSAAIANFNDFASWMTGCTVRVNGDSQDNEITSSTLLARPFEGSTGAQTAATVFADCVQLDYTVSAVLNPVFIASPTCTWLRPIKTRMEFARIAGVPLVTTPEGEAYDWPFYFLVRKAVSRPLWWYLEAAYYSPLGYVPRRIRLAPMPNAQYSLGYRIESNMVRYTQNDVYVTPYTDPLTLLPINDGEVESLLMPIFVKKLSEMPQFKNLSQMPSIMEAYKEAKCELSNIRAQPDAPIWGGYR